MALFNILDLGDFNYRCVLGEKYYFDFTICQYELFGYGYFYKSLKECEGNIVFNLQGVSVGEVVSIKNSSFYKEICILVRTGELGELFFKSLKGD